MKCRILYPAFQFVNNVRFVHAGCGVNALSGLQKHVNSIHC
ncbi:4-phosphopantetheinyl transferase EntD [Escherichia coli]|nr:4-phosphopantetheinyl transferase EntD [Escherichia coli]